MNRPTLWLCQTAARNPPKRRRGCTIVGCLLARETQGFQEVYPLLALDLEAAQAVDQGLLGLGGGGEVGGDAARSIAVADLVEGLPPASHGLGLVALALVVDCRRACEVALVIGFLEKGGWRFSAAQHGDARMLPTSRSTWASGGCSRRPSPAAVVWWVRESRGRCWGGGGVFVVGRARETARMAARQVKTQDTAYGMEPWGSDQALRSERRVESKRRSVCVLVSGERGRLPAAPGDVDG